MQSKEDLDLLYYYIRDETRTKKQQIEDMVRTSEMIAIVKQNPDTGYRFGNKFCAYKIEIDNYKYDIQYNDVKIIIPAIVLTL